MQVHEKHRLSATIVKAKANCGLIRANHKLEIKTFGLYVCPNETFIIITVIIIVFSSGISSSTLINTTYLGLQCGL